MTNISAKEIKNLVKENLDFAKKIKNYLHENPELSSKEFETRKFLINECKKIGLEVEEVENSTGFVAILDTKRNGKILGLRTDIDALPIFENENNLKKKKLYQKILAWCTLVVTIFTWLLPLQVQKFFQK